MKTLVRPILLGKELKITCKMRILLFYFKYLFLTAKFLLSEKDILIFRFEIYVKPVK